MIRVITLIMETVGGWTIPMSCVVIALMRLSQKILRHSIVSIHARANCFLVLNAKTLLHLAVPFLMKVVRSAASALIITTPVFLLVNVI